MLAKVTVPNPWVDDIDANGRMVHVWLPNLQTAVPAVPHANVLRVRTLRIKYDTKGNEYVEKVIDDSTNPPNDPFGGATHYDGNHDIKDPVKKYGLYRYVTEILYTDNSVGQPPKPIPRITKTGFSSPLFVASTTRFPNGNRADTSPGVKKASADKKHCREDADHGPK